MSKVLDAWKQLRDFALLLLENGSETIRDHNGI
jgi:hypothetical protein